MIQPLHPAPALRPFLLSDTPLLAALFRSSIEELTGDDYSEAQQEAWASQADDEEVFAKRLASRLTLIATVNGTPAGFASLEGNEHVDMLYVHPGRAGQGIGTLLLDALEKLARARGAARLTTDASDTARAFFEKRGFIAQRRNTVERAGEWLANTTLEKRFPANDQERKP